MLLIPAIDLKDGRCVRLKQGDMSDSTTFGEDPAAMARRWVDAGARRLHLVDLNGAFAGKPVNEPAIRAIAAGSSPKVVASFMSPWRRRTHLPSLRSIAGISSMAGSR